MKGELKMKKDYGSIQKEIDKLLLETSKMKTGKTYLDMQTNKEYISAMKKIGKLVIDLEIIQESDRKSEKRKRKINT